MLVGVLALFMLLLFIGPRLPDDLQAKYCVVNVHLPKGFGVSLNCDSPEFLRLAREPSALLEAQNTRQSRPGLIAVAAALRWALTPLNSLLTKVHIQASRSDIDPNRISGALANDVTAYLAYIIINIGIILAVFYCLLRTCEPWTVGVRGAPLVLTAGGMLLLANDCAKDFLWSPHNQLFILFVPVFAFHVTCRALFGALVNPRFAIGTGLAIGFGMTAYPLFAVACVSVSIGGVYFALTHASKSTLLRSVAGLLIVAVLTVLPWALWMLFVRLKTGAFYFHDASGQDAMLMAKAWREGIGALLSSLFLNVRTLLMFAWPQAIPTLSLGLFAAAAGMLGRRKAGFDRRFFLLSLAASLVSAIVAIFYAMVVLLPRIAFAITPPLTILAVAGALAVAQRDPTKQKAVVWGSGLIALAAATYTILKFPFS